MAKPRSKKTKVVKVYEEDFQLLEVFMREAKSEKTEDGFKYGTQFIDKVLRENKELREQAGIKPQSFTQSYVM